MNGLDTELVPWLAAHKDVNIVDTIGVASEAVAAVQKTAAKNVQRVVHFDGASVGYDEGRRSQSSYAIFDFQE